MVNMVRNPGIHLLSKLYVQEHTKKGHFSPLHFLSDRLITQVGVAYLVQCFRLSTGNVASRIRYHGLGTGVSPESPSDTAITELTSAGYTRIQGTQAVGTTPNVFVTSSEFVFDSAFSITEHGIFTDQNIGAGVLFDRSVFDPINVVSGDSFRFVYTLELLGQ